MTLTSHFWDITVDMQGLRGVAIGLCIFIVWVETRMDIHGYKETITN